jgi:hypothetical protein
MFQYAAARALALRNDTELLLDSSWINGSGSAAVGRVRRYELGCFQVDALLRPITDVAQPATSGRITRQLQQLRLDRGPVVAELAEPPFGGWCPEVLEAPDNTYLNGYWHSSHYFEDAEPFLRAEFAFKNGWDEANTAIAELIGASGLPTVSAHVRRGDYVTDPGANRRLGTLAPSYYQRAVERIQAETGPPHIFVFSDEPQWCRDHLDELGYETTIVDVNNTSQAANDLRLMALCDHHVVANSTFSWWGAWLNPDSEKIVIAPEPWLLDPRWPDDLRVPRDWIKLDRTERPAAIPAYSALRRSRIPSTATMVLASPADPDRGDRDTWSLRVSLLTGIGLTVLRRLRLVGWGLLAGCVVSWVAALDDGGLTDRFDVALGVGGAICLIAATVLLMTARSAAIRQPADPDRGDRDTWSLRVSLLTGIGLTVLRRVRLVGWGLLAGCVVSWVAALGDGGLTDNFDVATGVGGAISLIAATVLLMTARSAAVRQPDRF